MGKARTIIFWGLIWMVIYLYAYEALWTIAMRPVPGPPYDTYYYRTSIESPAVFLRQVLWVTSFPSVQVLHRRLPAEIYTREMVYLPFGVAIQWFGYGCLFGWWRAKRLS